MPTDYYYSACKIVYIYIYDTKISRRNFLVEIQSREDTDRCSSFDRGGEGGEGEGGGEWENYSRGILR